MKFFHDTTPAKLDADYRAAVEEFGEKRAKAKLVRLALRAIENGRIPPVATSLEANCMSFDNIGWQRGNLQARLALAKGDVAWARSKASRLIARVGREPLLLLSLAKIAHSTAQLEEARGLLAEILALKSAWRVDAVLLLADVLAESDKESRNLDDARVWFAYGVQARQAGRVDSAADAFLRAIELRPGWEPPIMGLKFAISSNPGLLPEAIRVLEQVRQQRPQARHVLGLLSRLYEEHGDIEKSVAINYAYGRVTAAKKNPEFTQKEWPKTKDNRVDFVIVGPPKTGTTSLFGYLAGHPKVLPPHTKEIDFFTLRYANGLAWYLSNFPTICDVSEFISGEASPGYFAGRDADKRIQQDLRDPKVIIMLRNPVDRTISAYHQRKKMSGLNVPIEQLIEEQLRKKAAGEIDLDYGSEVLGVSTYPPKLRRWFDTLGRENCLVINADKFFADTHTEMEKVFGFLGIDSVHGNYTATNVGRYKRDREGLKGRLYEHFLPEIEETEHLLGEETGWR